MCFIGNLAAESDSSKNTLLPKEVETANVKDKRSTIGQCKMMLKPKDPFDNVTICIRLLRHVEKFLEDTHHAFTGVVEPLNEL